MRGTSFRYAVVLSFVLLLLPACVPSLHPIYTSKTKVFLPELIGRWKQKGHKSTWMFARGKNNSYRALFVDEKGKKGWFTACLTTIGGHLFIDFYPDPPDLDANGFYKLHLIRAHTFALVESTKPELKFAVLNPDWLKKALKENPKLVRYEQIDKDRVVLTASTGELRSFLMKCLKTRNAFAKPAIYEKVQ